MWRSIDPRLTVGKRANIIILRPCLSGNSKWEAGTGQVDTKNMWNIFTSFEGHKIINADEEWDKDWMWAFVPE